MLNSIIKRELNSRNFIIPFCFRHKSESNIITHSDDKDRIQEKSKPLTIEDNPYYSKYAEKIKLKEKHSKIEEKNDEDKNCDEVKQTLTNFKEYKSCKDFVEDNKPNEAYSKEAVKHKSLNDIVHLSLLAKHTATEIEKIWTDYHCKKAGYLYAVIPSEQYIEIYKNGKIYPTFVYPLPKVNNQSNDSYQFFLGQFNNHEIYFTPLAMYHLHKENAISVISVIHYPELISEKGIVLMQGRFDERIIKCTEAQCLLYQIQLYYRNNSENSKLLYTFNQEPDRFDYRDTIKIFEKGIST